MELASDIELHAEKIRRERNAKRAKQQAAAEAEAALTARGRTDVGVATAVAASTTPGVPGTGQAETLDSDQPLVGNLIGEDHANYVLMYNMLTGIRIGASLAFLIAPFYLNSFLFFL